MWIFKIWEIFAAFTEYRIAAEVELGSRLKVFCLFFPLFAGHGIGAQTRDWVAVGLPEKPMRWMDENGRLQGFDVDFLNLVSSKIGIKYKLVLVDSSARILLNARNSASEYDMLLAYSHMPDRESYLAYPKESHIQFKWNFFVLRDRAARFDFESYSDLKNAKIGVTRGMSYTPEFWQAVESVPLVIDEVSTNRLQLDKLLAGRFDLVPLNTKTALWEAKERGVLRSITFLPKTIKSTDYYNVFVRNSNHPRREEFRLEYDRIVAQMKRDGTLKKLQARYGLD